MQSSNRRRKLEIIAKGSRYGAIIGAIIMVISILSGQYAKKELLKLDEGNLDAMVLGE